MGTQLSLSHRSKGFTLVEMIIVMTILGPILFSALMIVPVWLATQEQEKHFIEVIDDSKLVDGFVKESENIRYDYPPVSLEEAKRDFYSTEYMIQFLPLL